MVSDFLVKNTRPSHPILDVKMATGWSDVDTEEFEKAAEHLD